MTASVAPPVPVTEPQVRDDYGRVAALGLLLIAVAPAMMMTAGLLAGLSFDGEMGFIAAMIAIPLIGAALVWRFGTWAKVVGIIAAVLPAVAMFWVVFGLAYPASFVDFVPGILVPVGLVLGVGGSIAGIVTRRRGPKSPSLPRRLMVGALAIVVVAAIGSAAATLLLRSTADAEGVAVELADFEFTEDAYTVPAGETATITVHNSDPFAHTFTVPDLGIDETVLPGSSVVIEVEAPTGEYTIYCKPHSDMEDHDPETAGMAARLVAS